MKNQYVGDINDYVKYSLLRTLASIGRFDVGVCWMRTSDDGRSDGGKTGYLGKPDQWRAFHPELFDALSQIVLNDRRRSLRSLETRRIVPSARYFSRLLTDTNRESYFERAESALNEANLVFFDPDNGMEVPSIPIGRRGSSKYLYWSELSRFVGAGHSVLVFQHFPRMERKKFVTLSTKKFRRMLGATRIYSIASSNVVYLLLPQERHREAIAAAVEEFRRRWRSNISINECRS